MNSNTHLPAGIDPDHTSILDAARCLCEKAIDEAFQNPSPVLVDALPAMGKSSGVIRWAAQTGKPLTVLTARRDLYREYVGWCENNDLTHYILPSFHNDCPTAKGEYGEKWADRVSKAYEDTNAGGRRIHTRAVDLFGEELPCEQKGTCPYCDAHSIETNDVDVLIGHYRHSYVTERIAGRYLVIDEFPEGEFLTQYSSDVVNPAVSNYLEQQEAIPFQYRKDIVRCRDLTRVAQAIEWFHDQNPRLKVNGDSNSGKETHPIHSDAARLTYASLAFQELENRWERAELPTGEIAVREPGDEEKITILRRPNLEPSESVVALDGTPTVEMWRLLLGPQMECSQVLNNEDRGRYLRDGLGIEIVQTTKDMKPYNSGEYVTAPSDRALFAAIEQREGARPSLISSKKAIEEYSEIDALVHIDRYQHYYDMKGMNDFGGVRLGVVAGSPQPGDTRVELFGALAGKSIEWNGEYGVERSYGYLGDKFLHGLRENEVLQAVLRFGRTEVDDERGATVYVHTGALPEWVPVSHQPIKVHQWDTGSRNGMNQVLTAIGDKTEWKTSDVANSPTVRISRKQVIRNLTTLAEYGYIGQQNMGKGIGYRYWNERVDEAIPYGHVTFGSETPT